MMRVVPACDHKRLNDCPPQWHQRWSCDRCGACWRCGRINAPATVPDLLIGDDAPVQAAWSWSDEAEAMLRDGVAWWPLINEPLPPECEFIAAEFETPHGRFVSYCHRPSVMAIKAAYRVPIMYFCDRCWMVIAYWLDAARVKLLKEDARK